MAVMAVPLLTSMGASAATAATIGSVISGVGTAMSVMGAISGYRASQAQAKAVTQQAAYQAKTAEIAAGQSRAEAQHRAEEDRRQGRLALSRAIAVGASSGGGAADPTVVNIAGDIAGDTEYRALSSLYAGEERARNQQQQADLSRYEGATQAVSIKASAKNKLISDIGGTLLSAGAGMAGKYSSMSPSEYNQTIFDSDPRKLQRGFEKYGSGANKVLQSTYATGIY
jgi:hypothetical protein